MARKAHKWNPSLHPRDARGRFTRSSTRVMKGSDTSRARSALSGFSPAKIGAEADAAAWIESKTGKPLSEESALSRYLAGGWRETNPAIRSQKTPPPEVAEIDAEFDELDEDVMLRRQVPLQMFAHIPVDALTGMKVRDAAYASTSLDRPDAGPSAGDAVTMHIAATAGTLAFINGPDGEILLGRDTEIAITRAEPNGRGGWDVYGAVIPQAAVKRDRAAGNGDQGDQGDGQTASAPAGHSSRAGADAADGPPDAAGGTGGRGSADTPRAAAADRPAPRNDEEEYVRGFTDEELLAAAREVSAGKRQMSARIRKYLDAEIQHRGLAADRVAPDLPDRYAQPRKTGDNAPAAGTSTPGDAGEPGPLPDEGALAAFSPIDRERIRVAVEDHAARIYRSPMVGGSKDDAARYVSEGPLGKLADREGLGPVWKAVDQVLTDRPELLTRTPEESERAAAARAERVDAMGSQAAKLTKDGDYAGALEVIDQAEQIAPDHRSGKPTPTRSWDDLRGIVRRRQENDKPAAGKADQPAGDAPAADAPAAPDTPADQAAPDAGEQLDTPTDAGEGREWIAPADGALAALAPVDRERVRIAVEDNAARIFRTPMMGGTPGNVARYVAEGRDLRDVSNQYGFRPTVDAVSQILADRPELMHRTDEDVAAGVEARRADAKDRTDAAGAAIDRGDFTAARAELDAGEAIDPGYTMDIAGPPIGWPAMRRIVDDAERERGNGDQQQTGDETPAAGTSAPNEPEAAEPTRNTYKGHGSPETFMYYGHGYARPNATGRLARAEARRGGQTAVVDAETGQELVFTPTAKFWTAPAPAGDQQTGDATPAAGTSAPSAPTAAATGAPTGAPKREWNTRTLNQINERLLRAYRADAERDGDTDGVQIIDAELNRRGAAPVAPLGTDLTGGRDLFAGRTDAELRAEMSRLRGNRDRTDAIRAELERRAGAAGTRTPDGGRGGRRERGGPEASRLDAAAGGFTSPPVPEITGDMTGDERRAAMGEVGAFLYRVELHLKDHEPKQGRGDYYAEEMRSAHDEAEHMRELVTNPYEAADLIPERMGRLNASIKAIDAMARARARRAELTRSANPDPANNPDDAVLAIQDVLNSEGNRKDKGMLAGAAAAIEGGVPIASAAALVGNVANQPRNEAGAEEWTQRLRDLHTALTAPANAPEVPREVSRLARDQYVTVSGRKSGTTTGHTATGYVAAVTPGGVSTETMVTLTEYPGGYGRTETIIAYSGGTATPATPPDNQQVTLWKNARTGRPVRNPTQPDIVRGQVVRDTGREKVVRGMLDAQAAERSAPATNEPTGDATPAAGTSVSPAALIADREALAASVASGIAQRETLGGGSTALVELVTLNDGSRAVFKHTYDNRVRNAGEQQDAEELGPLALAAFGVRAPAVHRGGPTETYAQYIDGKTGMQAWEDDPGSGRAQGERVAATDAGRLLGLADVVLGNIDRNAGNWMLDGDGELVGIDHGDTFLFPRDQAAPPKHINEFMAPYVLKERGVGAEWAEHDISPADIAAIRARLAELRPEFVRLGRAKWHDAVMVRLQTVGVYATGDRNRIAVGDDTSAPTPAAGTPVPDAPAPPEAQADDMASQAARRMKDGDYDGALALIDQAEAIAPGHRPGKPGRTRSWDDLRDIVSIRRGAAPAPAADTYTDPRERLAAGVASGIANRRTLTGGFSGAGVELVTFTNGDRAVRKVTRDDKHTKRSAAVQQDAEELSAAVASALGASVPTLHRGGPDEIYLEYVDGLTGVQFPDREEAAARYARTDAGRLLGLADLLTSNADRNHGNWIVDGDDRVVGIDHGLTFWDFGEGAERPTANEAGAFTRGFVDWGGSTAVWADNDLTPADVAEARRRVEALRPEFERLGHTDWHDFAVARLDAVGAHASGDRNRIAEGDDLGYPTPAVDTSTPDTTTGDETPAAGTSAPDAPQAPAAAAQARNRRRVPAGVTPEYRKAYERGWRASQRGANLDHADARNEPDAWYDGYGDHAVGRDKWESATPKGREEAGLAALPAESAAVEAAPYAERRDRLDAAVAGGVAERDEVIGGGGFLSDVEVVTFANGDRAIRKTVTEEGGIGRPVDEMQDAEELGAAIAAAVGAPVPAVHRAGPAEIYVEYVDGRTAMDLAAAADNRSVLAPHVVTDEARLLGLADLLMANTDRHDGNWMVDQGGRLVGIDHGLAFYNAAYGPTRPSSNESSPFTAQFMTTGDFGLATGWADHDFTPADMAEVRRRLVALAPQFDDKYRGDWHNFALTRLDAMTPHAKGTRNLIAEGDDISAPPRVILANVQVGDMVEHDGEWSPVLKKTRLQADPEVQIRKGNADIWVPAAEVTGHRQGADAPDTGDETPAADTSAPAGGLPIHDPDTLAAAVADMPDPERTRKAVGAYRNAGYGPINRALRDARGGQITDQRAAGIVADLDALMARSETTEPVTLYRGVGDAEAAFGDAWTSGESMVGHEGTDHGFASTSTSPDAAERFGGDDIGVVARYNVPAGVPALGFRDGVKQSEEEVILGRGLRYRVTGDRTENGRRVLDVDILPPGADTGDEAPAAGTDAPDAPETPEARAERAAYEAVRRGFAMRGMSDEDLTNASRGARRAGDDDALARIVEEQTRRQDAQFMTPAGAAAAAERRAAARQAARPASETAPAGPDAAPSGPARQADMFGGVTDFVPAPRAAIGLADRPNLGRERAMAAVQQLGMFDVSDQQQMDGQMAMLDALLDMPAVDTPPPPAPPAPEPAALAAPDAPASIVPDDLSGWNDEQLAETFRTVTGVHDEGDVDEDGAARIMAEWERRETAMADLVASVPADLTGLPEDEVMGLYARLTGELGTMDHPTVERVGAELDRRQEAERLDEEVNAPKRALLARPLADLTDDEVGTAAEYASDLDDVDALNRVYAEWERRDTERETRERIEREARETAEREAALEAAREAERAAAAEHAAAQRDRLVDAMAAAQDAAIVPAFTEADVNTAVGSLGETGMRALFGDQVVDEWLASLPESSSTEVARNGLMMTGARNLPARDRLRLVLAAGEQEGAKEFADWSDRDLHTAVSQGMFSTEPPNGPAPKRELGRRAGRETTRRKLQKLREDNAREFRQFQIRAMAGEPRTLTDAELEVAPALVAATNGGDDFDVPGRLDALRAEAQRREAAAGEIAERKAAGPAAPARYRHAVEEYGRLRNMVRSGSQPKDNAARDRLRRAQAAVYGLPEDADAKAIKAAEKKDPRPVVDQAAQVMAWFRHLGQYEGVAADEADYYRGKPDEADVPDTPDPLPPANVSKADEVWQQILDTARADMADGRYETARRVVQALARTYRIPAEDAEDTEADIRRLQEEAATSLRWDDRNLRLRAADYIAQFRALAADDDIDPSDTARYGPPDKGGRRTSRAVVRRSTPEQEKRIDALVARGWDWLDAYAEVHGVDRAAVEGRSAGGRSGMKESEIRAAYAEWVELQYLAANAATNGFMLSPEAEQINARRGRRSETLIDPRDLFSGPWSTARAHASEELLRWWGENQRMSYADFKAQLIGGDAARASRERLVSAGKGNEYT